MLRRFLTAFRKDKTDIGTVGVLGSTAILCALAIPVSGIVTSSLPTSLHKIQHPLHTGQAVAGAVTITNLRPPDLAEATYDG